MAAFVILFLKKIKVVRYMQERGNEFISDLFSCDFCLSFWFSAIISVVMWLYFADSIFLIIPIFSTPITRILQ